MIFLVFLIPGLAFAQPRWEPLQQKVIEADLTTDRGDQKKLAKEALTMAEQCLAVKPNEIGCRYYRAQALGLSSKNLFGYTDRLRRMFADWEAVLKADPRFDYGGPYRMFAEVYMELPKHFGPKDLRQDLNKAVDYLKKATEISDYPTNWLDLAEAYDKLGQKKEAQQALEKANRILPRWRDHPYYPTWASRK